MKIQNTGHYLYSIIVLFTGVMVSCQPKVFPVDDSDRTPWEHLLTQRGNWYGREEAQQIAGQVLLFQRSSGGWPKNINMAKPLTKELADLVKAEKDKADATIDNGTTFPQLRFLAKMFKTTKNKDYLNSFFKGFDYLIGSQYPNGGWPQFYPLRKGYYSHITFNDDAMTGVLYLLRDIADKKPDFLFVDESRRLLAQKAVEKGLDVILKTQIKVNGKLTAWCAQYDENRLAPTDARTFEPASISGNESVGIVEYLMDLKNPSTEVVTAIESACRWFEESKITGYKLSYSRDTITKKGFTRLLVPDPNGGPLWARFYDIKTNQPMYIDRGGINRASHNELSDERRNNYAYIGDFAKKLLEKEYPEWKERVVSSE